MQGREWRLSVELPIILVIEDDDAVQSLVEDTLSEGGFEPAIAASGEEAVTPLAKRTANPASDCALATNITSTASVS